MNFASACQLLIRSRFVTHVNTVTATLLYCGRISRAMNTLGKLARVNIGLSRNFAEVENCINNSQSIMFVQIQNEGGTKYKASNMGR